MDAKTTRSTPVPTPTPRRPRSKWNGSSYRDTASTCDPPPKTRDPRVAVGVASPVRVYMDGSRPPEERGGTRTWTARRATGAWDPKGRDRVGPQTRRDAFVRSGRTRARPAFARIPRPGIATWKHALVYLFAGWLVAGFWSPSLRRNTRPIHPPPCSHDPCDRRPTRTPAWSTTQRERCFRSHRLHSPVTPKLFGLQDLQVNGQKCRHEKNRRDVLVEQQGRHFQGVVIVHGCDGGKVDGRGQRVLDEEHELEQRIRG
mmetsp:Transcript_10589/g.65181  ORF Transcript_10589/g.65181 Transcript_10589/m.65181 type:complete len:258 (-) Transcript_10589:2591-3364(-)